MIICPACKTELLDGSLFCDYCGARLNTERSSAVIPPTPGQPGVQTESDFTKNYHDMHSKTMAPPNSSTTNNEENPIPVNALQVTIMNSGRDLSFPWTDKRALSIGRRDPGRGIFPDIDLTEDGAVESGVSRMHARIIMGIQTGTDGQHGVQFLQVEDTGSSNGTFLARQQLPTHQPAMLRNGDEVRFGRMVVRFSWTDEHTR